MLLASALVQALIEAGELSRDEVDEIDVVTGVGSAVNLLQERNDLELALVLRGENPWSAAARRRLGVFDGEA